MGLLKIKGRYSGKSAQTSNYSSLLRTLFFFSLAAAIAATYLLAESAYRSLYRPALPAIKTLASIEQYSGQVSQSHRNTLENLKTFDFFGTKHVAAPEPKQQSIENIPKTRLNIQLTGILAHAKADKSLAIVSVSGQQQTLKAGDKIENTPASIASVWPDRIVVNHRGKQEVVLLRPDDQKTNLVTASTSQPVAHETSHPTSVDDLIQLTVIREGDQIAGYRITPGRFSAAYEKAGFNRDDIAIEIDGQDLTDNDLAEELLSEISFMQNAEITVKRGSQKHLIQLSI